MKRVLAAVALAGVSGCYGSAYVEPTPVYQTTTEYAPYETPAPVTVTVAPPPMRYEPALSCGYGTQWFPGRWEFRSSWYWARGYCSETRPGYVYVAPRYVNGVYYRAHWGQPSVVYGGGYGGGVRPAPVYGGGGSVYVAPGAVRPAPVYGGGGSVYVAPGAVRPAPVYGGGGSVYVPPPGGVRPAPVYGGGGGNVYVAPSGVAHPAPAPAYGGGSVYVPPPGGGRPAPVYGGGGGYSPPPAVRPAPQPAPYRGQPAPARSVPPGYRPATPPAR